MKINFQTYKGEFLGDTCYCCNPNKGLNVVILLDSYQILSGLFSRAEFVFWVCNIVGWLVNLIVTKYDRWTP